MPNTWIANFSFREQTLYPQLCYVAYWLNSITSGNTFIADFKQLLAKYPSVNTRLLGFPCNWEQEPLWRSGFISSQKAEILYYHLYRHLSPYVRCKDSLPLWNGKRSSGIPFRAVSSSFGD